jgi:hypothetical protein
MLPTISRFDARQATRFPMELLPRNFAAGFQVPSRRAAEAAGTQGRGLESPDEGVDAKRRCGDRAQPTGSRS